MSHVTIQTFSSANNEEVADALLALATPFLSAAGDDKTMRHHILSMAVTGWNLSLFPPSSEEGYQAQVEEKLPQGLAAENRALLTQFVIAMITGRQERYPAMRKGIQTWNHGEENGEIRLTVSSLPVKPG